ncbi:MAG TPA: hypothetical protein VFT22_08890 [Kofleriaceae bacterium]|nr:hypothetical protein [Kofleriaceae bacterium]
MIVELGNRNDTAGHRTRGRPRAGSAAGACPDPEGSGQAPAGPGGGPGGRAARRLDRHRREHEAQADQALARAAARAAQVAGEPDQQAVDLGQLGVADPARAARRPQLAARPLDPGIAGERAVEVAVGDPQHAADHVADRGGVARIARPVDQAELDARTRRRAVAALAAAGAAAPERRGDEQPGAPQQLDVIIEAIGGPAELLCQLGDRGDAAERLERVHQLLADRRSDRRDRRGIGDPAGAELCSPLLKHVASFQQP